MGNYLKTQLKSWSALLTIVAIAHGSGTSVARPKATSSPVQPTFKGAFELSDKLTSLAEKDVTRGPKGLQLGCQNRKPKDLPQICITATDSRRYRKGQPITAQIRWSHVPAGAGMMVYLERGDAHQDTRYLGMTGALRLNLVPVSGDGETRFTWNGRKFACTPTDFPKLCATPAEIGRYYLRAVVYENQRLQIVGWPPPNPQDLAHDTSLPFLIDGTPDLHPIARSLWWAAVTTAQRSSQMGWSNSAANTDGDGLPVFQRGTDRLCAHIKGSPPYVSSLEACVSKAAVIGSAGLLYIDPESAEVTGDFKIQARSMSREKAIGLAQNVADIPYLHRVAFRHQTSPVHAGYDEQRDGDFYAWSQSHPLATTYLNDNATDAVFRPDLGGSWLIILEELMGGGSSGLKRDFADEVLVLVQPTGQACVIETKRYQGAPFHSKPATDSYSCADQRKRQISK